MSASPTPNAPTPATVTGGDNPTATPNRFVPQCFLLDFYPKFVRANSSTPYSQFSKLNCNPATGINVLMNKGQGFALNQLTPAQLSLLVPKFRLYKVVTKGQRQLDQKEFYFDDTTMVPDRASRQILKMRTNPRGRPHAVGFKSFAWEDLGTDPGNQGAAFKAELTLVFANMDSLFNRENGVAAVDLLNAGPSVTPKYKDSQTKIRVDVGWTLGKSAANNIGNLAPDGGVSQKDILKAINSSTVSFFLSLAKHELSINENGTIELKIEYIASTDTLLRSPASDIFFDKKDAESGASALAKAKSVFTDGDDLAWAPTDTADLDQSVIKGASLEALKKREQSLIDAGQQGTIYDSSALNQVQAAIKTRSEAIEKLEREAEAGKEAALLKKYGMILNEITMKNKLYFVDLSDEALKLIQALNRLYSNPKLTPQEQLAQRTALIANSSKLMGTSFDVSRSPSRPHPDNKKLIDAAGETTEESWYESESDRETAKKKIAEGIQDRANEAKKLEDKRIDFFYLGDLFNYAFGKVRAAQSFLEDKYVQSYVIGKIDLKNPETGAIDTVNLADIPICLPYFEQWFQENVIKPLRPKYIVRDFCRDIVSQLVVNALGPTCFGASRPTTITKVGMQNMSLPNRGRGKPLSDGKIYSDASIRGLVNWEGVDQKTMKDFTHYFYIFCSGFTGANLKGNYKEDQKKGILHLQIGADQGLLKTVKFERQDQPGQTEVNISKASEAGVVGNLLFSDRYNANISMFGNTFLQNGMMVYLDPSGLGVGKPSDISSPAAQMGIGGYYMITKVDNIIESGKFETNVSKAILQCFGKDEARQDADLVSQQALLGNPQTNEPSMDAAPD